jgi:hypothetical protein
MSARRYEICQFDDVVEAGAAIRDGSSVEVSIVAAGSDVGRRVIDFLAGVAVTGSATMTRIEPGVFSIVPERAGLPAGDSRRGLISLPRVRPSSVTLGALLAEDPDVVDVAAVAGAQMALVVRRRDRPFWPDNCRP